MILQSRFGRIFLVAYSAIFLSTVSLNLYDQVYRTANSALSGVPAILVTAPWSLLLTPLWVASGYIDWYNRFASTPAVLGLCGTLTLLPGAICNAGLAYWVGKLFDRSPRSPGL